jgi:hypothetical protein
VEHWTEPRWQAQIGAACWLASRRYLHR